MVSEGKYIYTFQQADIAFIMIDSDHERTFVSLFIVILSTKSDICNICVYSNTFHHHNKPNKLLQAAPTSSHTPFAILRLWTSSYSLWPSSSASSSPPLPPSEPIRDEVVVTLWRWRWCQESNLEFFLWCATLAQKRVGFSWESLVGYIKSATSPWEGCTSKHKLDNSLHYRNIWFCGIPLSGFAMNVSFSFQAHPHTCVKRCFCFSASCYVLFRRRAFVANPVCWGKKRLLYLKSMCPPWAAWTLWKEVQKNKSTQLGFRFESWFFHDLLR